MAFELLAQRSQDSVTLRNVVLCRLPTAIRSLWLAAEPTTDDGLLPPISSFVRISHAEAGGRAVYVS
ncbi:hypothetical protein SAMN05216277_11171 [Halolamina pelagica]|uniref:Uncharacterized protein n=1 Tax=Halolamina pelagica TaxID=699431 RepID=A0A1I5U2A7_9EURY|nr:hypothetical protein SAMN05216277_11171 [Halolamina pelagica]